MRDFINIHFTFVSDDVLVLVKDYTKHTWVQIMCIMFIGLSVPLPLAMVSKIHIK